MKKKIVGFVVSCALLFASLTLPEAAANDGGLAKGFVNPPVSARPGVWWVWVNGNVTKEGITRDLEAMARQGVGKVLLYDTTPGLPLKDGNAKFFGTGWRALFVHALAEADRLGILVDVNNGSGFNCGGPWIDAGHTSQKLIWSKKTIDGPAKFDAILPMPEPVVDKYCRDVAVVAFRTAATEDEGQLPTATQSSTAETAGAARAIDGNTNGSSGGSHSVALTSKGGAQPWWEVDLKNDSIIDEIEIWRQTDAGGDLRLSHADVIVLDADRKPLWKANLGVVDKPSIRRKVGTSAMAQGWNATSSKARYVRIEKESEGLAIAEVLVFSGGRNIALGTYPSRIRNWEDKAARVVKGGVPVELNPGQASAEPPDVQPGSLIDLSAKMDASGRLEWDVPEGRWVVLRFAHTPLGVKLRAATTAGKGYELDPLSKEAMDLQFESLTKKLIEDAGPLAAKTLRSFWIDSWEQGTPNWTPKFREEFLKRRNYDLLPYLPVLAGKVVESPGVSDRFLWDYRRTLGEMLAENYYGRAAGLCRKSGVAFSAQAYGAGYADTIRSLGQADIPSAEIWTPPLRPREALSKEEGEKLVSPPDALHACLGFSASGDSTRVIEGSAKAAASAAHIYGKRTITTEGLTSYERGQVYPYFQKGYADRAFCEGINEMVVHPFPHQPNLTDRPGLRCLWGSSNGPNNTWWEQSHAWHSYLSRCGFLLQQGRYVADLCYYRGEGIPYAMRINRTLIPAGYDYDECNAEVILTRMSVKDGKIVLPDGMSYRLLVLPDGQTMTPRVLRKIAEMVEAGATVVGPKPTESPSLENYPACDKEVRELADKVWGPCDGKAVKEHAYGKGKVVWGKPIQEVLQSENIKPDFEFVSSQKDPVVRWIHRNDQGADTHGAHLSPNGAASHSPGQAPAPPWVMGEKRFCPEGAASQTALKLVPFGTDIYFVANQRNRPEELDVTFRVSGKAPELWHPDTGKITRPAVYDEVDGRTRMPLHLDPLGSVFVIFRDPAKADRIVSLSKDGKTLFPGGTWPAKETPMVEVLEEAADPVTKIREAAPTTTGAKASPAGATSNSPGQASAPPWDPKKTEPCPEGAASQNGTNTAPSKPVIKIWESGKYELKTASGKSTTVESGPITAPIEITGPWEVQFPPGLGAPESAVFDKLASWTTRPEAGIKYFSGTATYVKEIVISDALVGKETSLYLDLGRVKELAEVRLNGKDLGVLWKPPFRVEISQAIKPGINLLEVKVTNLWPNRQIGDAFLLESERITRTNDTTYKKESALLESGLLGPVKILVAERRELSQ